MFICPTCNREIDDPKYVKPRRTYTDADGNVEVQAPYPVCSCGRRLRSWVIGDLTAVTPVMGIVRGFVGSAVALVLAAVAGAERWSSGAASNLLLPIVIAAMSIYGVAAAWMGFAWSEREGPVRRLVPRAYGAAAGLLVPALLLAVGFTLGWARDLKWLSSLVTGAVHAAGL